MVVSIDADGISMFSSELQVHLSVGSHRKSPIHSSGPAGIVMTDDDCILVADLSNH